ncbi:MAG: dehydratase [Mesorhizobium amorphae]|nr:MAG: dehydratase [Mesorhizobium amorphae]
MTLDEYLGTGVTVDLGAHTFEADAIKAFAAKFDPQPFHLDEEQAKRSVLGGLCASGWHTASVWMKLNVATPTTIRAWDGPGPEPVFGPSPGFQNMRWPKPIYAGDTVRYTRTVLGHRRMASKPGWRIVTLKADARNRNGDLVMEFESAVLLKG